MKRAVIILITMMTFLSLAARNGRLIKILHTNDLHSRLIGYAPESEYTPLSKNDDKTVGGFARIAAIIKNESETCKEATLVLDAGDFTMGTLFPALENKSGFQLRLMKEMGYDVLCTGNHEYEFGPYWLGSVINLSSKIGKIPDILIGNAKFDRNDKGDDLLEALLAENVLKRKVSIIKNGIKIGIFSLLGKDAVEVAPKSAPVTFEKQTAFAKRMISELKSEKCEIIICLSHSGLAKGKSGKWEGEDVELAKAVNGIDLIIGGHSHTRLDQPLSINRTTIVQAGEFGRFVGCLSLIYTPDDLRVEDYRLIPVNDSIIGEEQINKLIDEQKKRINLEILKPLGLDYNRPLVEADFIIEGNDVGDYVNSNLGPFIADAIYFYVNKNNEKGTDVSMIAAGMIFDNVLTGIQTAPDIFRVVPLGSGDDSIPGYALARIYVNGHELKSILEILIIASKSKPSNYCYYSGLKVEYNPDRSFLRKIIKIEIACSDGSYENVNFSKKNKSLYSVTADTYMLEFIGIIKKMSFGLINVVPKNSEGIKTLDMKGCIIDMNATMEGTQEGKEWLALIEFIKSMDDSDKDAIPDIDKKYSVPVRTFFPVK